MNNLSSTKFTTAISIRVSLLQLTRKYNFNTDIFRGAVGYFREEHKRGKRCGFEQENPDKRPNRRSEWTLAARLLKSRGRGSAEKYRLNCHFMFRKISAWTQV